MGTDYAQAFTADGEGPVRPVTLSTVSNDRFPITNRDFADLSRTTDYRTESESLAWSFVFWMHLPAGPSRRTRRRHRGRRAVVVQSPGRGLASSRRPRFSRSTDGADHPVSTSHGTTPPPTPPGPASAADRGRMGIRRPRRPGAEAISLGRRADARTARTSATSGRASFRATTRRGWLRRHLPRRRLPAQRLRPVLHDRQRVGVVRRLVSNRLLTQRPRDDPSRPATGRKGYEGRVLSLPRLLLQSLPRGRPHLQHTGQRRLEYRFRCVRRS